MNIKNFLAGFIKPEILKGDSEIILNKEENLIIPKWISFELRLFYDALFYGYIFIAILSRVYNYQNTFWWGIAGLYVQSLLILLFEIILFKFIIKKFKKK